MNPKYKKLSLSSYFNELKRYRERVRVEILGERNQEYRQELKDLLRATDRRIQKVLAAMERNDNTTPDQV